jgi:DNA polymerase III subunit epsilon
MMAKILFFDTETTGLDPNKNALIQLAMIMDIDGMMVAQIKIDIQPFDDDMMLIGLADVGNNPQNISWKESKDCYFDSFTPTDITFSDIAEFPKPQEAIKQINTFLKKHISQYDKIDKAYIGGYNTPFDIAFLSKFYSKCKDNYLGSYINWKQLDVRNMLYILDFDGKIKLENYKLETACNHFGIELEAHNPLSDIMATRELFYILRGNSNV